MKIAKFPRPTWKVQTLSVTGTSVTEALQKRGPALEKALLDLEERGHKVRQVLETCLQEGKVWHYTILCE